MLEKSPYEHLLQIERQVSLADQQRLMSIETTFLALETVLREKWQPLKQQWAITEMIGRRMFYHYRTQKQLKQLLGISMAAAGASVLEQVIGTYLAAYLGQFSGFRVYLNRQFRTTSGERVRPDIAVTHGDQNVAALEAKTDLGWHRGYIDEGDWDKRREMFRSAAFSQSYLIIMSNVNWSGYRQEMDRQGVRVLFVEHPNDDSAFPLYTDEAHRLTHPDEIIHPVEPVFEQVAKGSG